MPIMGGGLLHVLDGLAANPAAPPDVLVRVAAVPRAANWMAWRQSDLPDTVVERLLATGDSTVALALDSPRQSEATRQRIAEHPDAGIRDARRRVVEHAIRRGSWVMPDDLAAYAGPGGLVGLARHEDPVLRAAVAGTWAAMPVALRRELLADPDPRVRKAAAGFPHPPAPADLHAVLLADETTRVEVASYAALTAEAVRECLAGDEELRGAVALNPTLPPAARDRLEQDPSQYVRSRVLLRQDLPEDRRRRLHAALLTEPEDVNGEVPFAMALLHHERPSCGRAAVTRSSRGTTGTPRVTTRGRVRCRSRNSKVVRPGRSSRGVSRTSIAGLYAPRYRVKVTIASPTVGTSSRARPAGRLDGYPPGR